MLRDYTLAVMDSETLDRWDDAVVLSVATTIADLRKPVSFEDLVNYRTHFMKFSAVEQIKAGRKVDKDGVVDGFWKNDKKTCEVARRVSYYPNKELDQPMADFVPSFKAFCSGLGIDPRNISICDRNLFDLRKLQHIIEVTLDLRNSEPWHYHNIFDVTSVILAHGFDRYCGINPYELQKDPTFAGLFVYHDPRHDAALDWLRMQKLCVEIGLIEDTEGWRHNGLYYTKV